jgi:hypothetical protein
MRRVTIACFCIFLSVSACVPLMPQVSQTVRGGSGESDRLKIESALQSYLTAYAHRSFPELLAVWPDLANQKKEYEKIKRHFTDPSVSGEEITVQLEEIQPAKDGVLVRAHRTEQFVKTDTSSTPGVGDNRLGEPRQFPGPYQSEKKSNVRKSGEVWITMRKSDDAWIIASISEKKPK